MRQEQVNNARDAYRYCQNITRRASKTFYWGSVFLPPLKRQAVWTVYALCRLVDDIVDEASEAPRIGHLRGSQKPQEELSYWREALTRLYQRGGMGDHPVQWAWSDMLEQYAVPLEPVLDLLDGVEMDLTIDRYPTFEELHLYCYKVAGTVGLMTSPIFGYQQEAALKHAAELGIALQLTNILRDVGEDARRGRIYIPLEDMRRFGYKEEELLSGVINDAFRELLRFEMERADYYYQLAMPGIAMLSADCRLAVRLSSTLYRGILDRIQLNNYNVFTKRASVPLQQKLATASQHWFQQRFEGRLRNAT